MAGVDPGSFVIRGRVWAAYSEGVGDSIMAKVVRCGEGGCFVEGVE